MQKHLLTYVLIMNSFLHTGNLNFMRYVLFWNPVSLQDEIVKAHMVRDKYQNRCRNMLLNS